MYRKIIFFLVIDTTLASDNPFRNNIKNDHDNSEIVTNKKDTTLASDNPFRNNIKNDHDNWW